MEVLYPGCAGLDVHQASVVACIRIAAGARASHEVRTFETTTSLLVLADWLREAGCTHVAMESTGVYWKPVKHIVRGIVRRGLKPVPTKASVSLRIDADVLEWFKAQGPGYQTRMNAVLRAFKDASLQQMRAALRDPRTRRTRCSGVDQGGQRDRA